MTIVNELQEEARQLYSKIKVIQDECSHPDSCVTYEYGANTGNYDPTADNYWVNFHCKLCDKYWIKRTDYWKDEIKGSVKAGMTEIKDE